jgi:hypothetical protein
MVDEKSVRCRFGGMREVSPIVLGIGLFLICGFIAAVGSLVA